MVTPSPFQIARETSNNMSTAFRRTKDESAIEKILTDSIQSGDPNILQNNISKILSQVSPERQGPAIKFLQDSYNKIIETQTQDRKKKAAEKYGIDPDLPPNVQAKIYGENAKNQRFNNAQNVFNPNSSPIVNVGQPQNNNMTPQTQNNIPSTGNTPPLQDAKARKQKLLELSGHPDREVSERSKAELKSLEGAEKQDRADLREKRKETLPLKQAIINRADLSRESIRNKSHLIDIIDRGQLDDPTFAIFAEGLPAGLGKRLLSADTVEYKGGLVDEFADLKNIFKGATRVKEVEIYENKLADVYLTDEQKKAILKSRINTAKVDLIREEAAAEIEEKYPDVSALQFNKKVEELAKPKIDALFNNIWDDQKASLDQAENRKKIPLDYNDPESRQILDQIMKEAGGNRDKARQIAKKKGYIVGNK